MKRKFLKRSLALAVAAAVTVTSLPTNLVFAEEAAAYTADDGEEPAAEGAADAGEEAVVLDESPEVTDGAGEAAGESAADTEGTVEIVSIEEASSDEVAELYAATPVGRIQNVRSDEDMIRWDADIAASRYEIAISDANGYDYRTSDDSYYSSSSPYMWADAWIGVYANKNVDGTLEKVEDADGYIRPFRAGQTYTIAVRGVNKYGDETVYGEWSAPLTYAVPAVTVPDQITGVAFDAEDNYLRWYGNADYYEVAITDAEGNSYYRGLNYDWDESAKKYVVTPNYMSCGYEDMHVPSEGNGVYAYKADAEGNLQRVTVKAADENGVEYDKLVTAFATGKTYSVSLRPVNADYSGTQKSYGEWTAPVAVTVTENAKPGKVGGLDYDEENEKLTWTEVEKTSGYEVEIKDANGLEYLEGCSYNSGTAVAEYYSTGAGRMDIYEDALYTWKDEGGSFVPATDAEGNKITAFTRGQRYTVRVRAYNYTNDGEKQAGEWSDAYTFTFAKEEEPALSKVAGVHMDGSYLRWTADKNAEHYEIAVADADGRAYYSGWTTDGDKAVMTYTTTEDVSLDLSEYPYLKTYVTVNDAPKADIHSDGTTIYAFEDGKTYTMCVRSVRKQWDSEAGKTVEVYGEWSNPVTYALTQYSEGVNAKPATVTGVKVRAVVEADDEYDDLYGAELQWNCVENAARYEILVTDASGRAYVPYCWMDGDELKTEYFEVYSSSFYPYIELSALTGLTTWVKNPGVALEMVKDAATGEYLTALAPGQTYSLQVRAVNEYTEWDAAAGKYKDTVEIPGDWSEAVSYTVSAVSPITDLFYVTEKDGVHYFTYSAEGGCCVWYQIATDAQFTSASLVSGTESDWEPYDAKTYKLEIDEENFNLKPGTTYYVRAVAGAKMPTKAELAAMTVPAAAFTTTVPAAPKTITGLHVYETYEDGLNFRFDAVLEDEDEFELQYTDKAAAAEEDWVIYDSYDAEDTPYFRTYNLTEGTWYVRAVAYTWADGEKVYGTPSNVVAVTVSRATSAVGTLTLAEQDQDGYTFDTDGVIRKSETIKYQISEAADFPSDKNLTWTEEESDTLKLYYGDLTPGKTYYVRARVYNPDAVTEETEYSAFSNVAAFTAKMPKAEVYTAGVTGTSITLQMSVSSDEQYLTGYQIQRKIGKKYVTLVKTTNNTYKNSGLKANKTYTYRVRPYYYDAKTGTTVNGSWAYCQANTWGASIDLTATPTGKTTIRLNWTKVKGASGYEIYRRVTDSESTSYSNGRFDSYSKYTLVKKITKASTVKYTDKKLTSGLSYEYFIRAYKTVGKKKYYIEDTAYADLSFGNAVEIRRSVRNADGSVKVYWTPVYAGDGYVIEQYDDTAEKWVAVAKKKKTASSYTIPAVEKKTRYRIRAYKGSEYSEESNDIWVYPLLAAPTGVKATANADGSVTVSWNAVAGADYYEVYRTTSSESTYNKNKKSYSYKYGTRVPVYAADASTVSGYKKLKASELTATTLTDRPITYTANGFTKTVYAGPKAGVKYYYYVVACKTGKAYNTTDTYDGSYKGNSGGSKAASVLISETTVKKPTLKSVKATKGKVTLKWKKVSGAQGYVVYRSTKKKSGYQIIATISKGSTVKYVDKTAKAKTKYYYKIRAIKYNEAGATTFSSYSKVKSVKAK